MLNQDLNMDPNTPIDAGYANFIKIQGFINFLKNYKIENVEKYYPILYKLSGCMNAQEDVDLFAEFLNFLYEKGYQKSVEDHKIALESHGLSTVLNF